MHIARTLPDLRAALAPYQRPAFVPTMGNLHDGHIALVSAALPLGDAVVASIFVNRLQFLPHEDFDTYPRTWDADCERLRNAGCTVLFAPSEQALYPQPQTCKLVPDPALADILEGQFRPGFFTGVCTVVNKLLQCVQPRTLLMGKKDYQQLVVVRHMVQQMAMEIEVMGCETLRADDGLALSSRNGYLLPAQRAEAVALSQILRRMADAVRNGRTDFAAIEADALATLTARGWQPDYLTVRQQGNLQAPRFGQIHKGQITDRPDNNHHGASQMVVLGAARLGGTRLIDNIEV